MTEGSEGPNNVPRRGHKSRLLQFNSNYGYLFTIISYLIGVFIFATIVGQVGNVITNRNANRLEFERLLDGAKTYMRHHKVPGGMKRRVLRWYDYSWSRGRIQGGGDINTALGLLPDKLKTELALHVNLSVLKKVTIFQECQPEFLHDLVLKMKAYIFTPGDLICRKGEVAREMFIIADGILDVISETGRVLTTMKAGDFFGEIGILNLDGLNKRTADVRSVGYSELFSLSREDVLAAMKDYPEAQEILQNLGRKRLMEAKNASKIYRAQAKQVKDHHDSSGDSDSTGKRIVEKLRSDVKGLKNVLRRSRRGTRTKEGLPEGSQETGNGKSCGQKQSLLRRMSHVQSSDEFDGNGEMTIHSPIGAGLPLLHRLKMFKEKQEREKEEREKGKYVAKEDEPEIEPIGIDFPLPSRLKPTKQKEETTSTGILTVRTQHMGVRFEKSTAGKSIANDSISGDEEEDGRAREKEELAEGKKADKFFGMREKNLPSRNLQESEMGPKARSSISRSPETESETFGIASGEGEENSVPMKLSNKAEVPKCKDGWELLKKSSITSSRSNRNKMKSGVNSSIRKVTERGTYLSKSDTVLEKQKTIEKDEEVQRLRSAFPSEGSTFAGEANGQRRKANSSGTCLGADNNEGGRERREEGEDQVEMKKYDSISDLSPEYSGLPFVKKLKILNERQKLAELERELIVRSASLDVPDGRVKPGSVLTRSRSEASTIESNCKNEARWQRNSNDTFPVERIGEIRTEEENESRNLKSAASEESIPSPESNETMERIHLKSILKKLSAEGSSTSDDDQIPAPETWTGEDGAEMRKLLRAPTIEGYAARHKKLTKSVTFDSDAMFDPDAETGTGSDDGKTKSFPPLSPTAILTLQLSNLSMIPIVGSPKGSDGIESRVKPAVKKKTVSGGSEKPEAETIVPKALEKLREKIEKIQLSNAEKEKAMMPCAKEKTSFPMLPFARSSGDEFLCEILTEIQKIVRGILVEAQNKFQLRCNSLEAEVKKRDEIIQQLQSKLERFEAENSSTAIKWASKKMAEPEMDGKENDFRSAPVTGGESFGASFDLNPSTVESARKRKDVAEVEKSNFSFDCLGNVVVAHSGTEVESRGVKAKINLPPKESHGNHPSVRQPKRKTADARGSEEEVELATLSRHSRTPEDTKRKRFGPVFGLRRNYSVDETQTEFSFGNGQKERDSREDREKRVSRSKGGKLMDRVTDFQRSFSCSHEKDFLALDIEEGDDDDDDESTSSEVEQPDNKDWEVQMLVEELEKKESWKRGSGWLAEEWISREAETDVKKLQKEVNTLKEMVCERNLTGLTNSELDMLETIIDARDRKISRISETCVRSNSLDREDEAESRGKSSRVGRREHRERSKLSLRQKIGQAFSFDFHDIDYRKSKPTSSEQRGKQRRFSLRKQKTMSGSARQERQSLHNLWHNSSLLRNRVVEDPPEVTNPCSSWINAGSSLPILVSSSMDLEKGCDLRTSLPSLAGRKSNLVEVSASSSGGEECRETAGEFDRSCDSVFETAWEGNQIENRHFLDARNRRAENRTTNGGVQSHNGSSSNGSSLNNFIKSVGQKMKQAMAGEMQANKNQVPTISKLCEEQLASKKDLAEAGCSEEFASSVTRRISLTEEETNSMADDDSFDRRSKTDPPDL